MDEGTKSTVSKLPLLSVRASPRDKEAWNARLKEELTALIQYVQINKEQDKDWFHIECNPHGTRWTGRCWYYYEQIRYEFDLEFDIPVTYPISAPELKLPQLEGLTSKMYRGGKICQTIHFQPLWARNVPRFGIAHSLALSVRYHCSHYSLKSTVPVHLADLLSFLTYDHPIIPVPLIGCAQSLVLGWPQKCLTWLAEELLMLSRSKDFARCCTL
jgi:ufm1-conjugating enzyme 1